MTRARGAALAVALGLAGVWGADLIGRSPAITAQTSGNRAAEIERLLIDTDWLIYDRLYLRPTVEFSCGGFSTGRASTICRALRSPDPVILAAAVRCLGRLETPRHMSLLTDVALHRDPAVRREAVHAISQVLFTPNLPFSADATNQAYVFLTEQIRRETDSSVLAEMFQTLAELRVPARTRDREQLLTWAVPEHPEALGGLATLLRLNGDLRISLQTREQLRKFADPRRGVPNRDAVEALALSRETDPLLIRALSTYHCPGKGLECGAEIRQLGLRLVSSPVEFVDVLNLSLSDPMFRVRIEALRTYAKFSVPKGSCYPFFSAIEDPSPHVAIEAVGLLQPDCKERDMVISALTSMAGRMAFDSERGMVWVAALVALAKFSPDWITEQRLEDLAIRQDSWMVRVEAVRIAAELRYEGLILKLAKDKHPNVRTEVLKVLYALPSSELGRVASESLDTDDHQLTLFAASMLKGLPEAKTAAPKLAQALERLTSRTNPTTREARLEIMARIVESGRRDVAAVIVPLVQDFDPVVVKAAVGALTALGDFPPQPLLRGPDSPFSPAAGRIDFHSQCFLVTTVSGSFTIVTPGSDSGTSVVARLEPGQAPVTATMFGKLVDVAYYDGLILHRYVPMSYVEGGSPQANYFSGAAFLRDEINLQRPVRGTVGVSRHGRHTGDMKFFINLQDNPQFEHDFTIFGAIGECKRKPIPDTTEQMLETVDKLPPGATIQRIRRIA